MATVTVTYMTLDSNGHILLSINSDTVEETNIINNTTYSNKVSITGWFRLTGIAINGSEYHAYGVDANGNQRDIVWESTDLLAPVKLYNNGGNVQNPLSTLYNSISTTGTLYISSTTQDVLYVLDSSTPTPTPTPTPIPVPTSTPAAIPDPETVYLLGDFNSVRWTDAIVATEGLYVYDGIQYNRRFTGITSNGNVTLRLGPSTGAEWHNTVAYKLSETSTFINTNIANFTATAVLTDYETFSLISTNATLYLNTITKKFAAIDPSRSPASASSILSSLGVISSATVYSQALSALTVTNGSTVDLSSLGVNFASGSLSDSDKKTAIKQVIASIFTEKSAISSFKISKTDLPVMAANAKDDIQIFKSDGLAKDISSIDLASTSIYSPLELAGESVVFTGGVLGSVEVKIVKKCWG